MKKIVDQTVTKLKPPLIPVKPVSNNVIIERRLIKSKIRKQQEKGNNPIILTDEQIAKKEKEILDETKNALNVWDEHPYQGVVVAIGTDVKNIEPGDHIAWRPDSQVGTVIIFNNKMYISLYQHDILFRYLTDKT